ncbi:MAG TPA: TonB-dependent receptor [Gemmatimonadales bacterium]
MRTHAAAVLLMLAAGGPAAAQATGALGGRVRDAATGKPLAFATVNMDGGRYRTVTDTGGAYRVLGLASGLHAVTVSLIGYAAGGRDSVLVAAGQTTILDFGLRPQAVPLGAVPVVPTGDPVLDPLTPADIQRISGAELHRLPVTTVAEAVALSAGAVGESYRGGRLGEQAFILDGLGVKNQIDASTGSIGIRVPPDMLTEASLVTNGFSARYGQAISGMVNVVTKDGGSRWLGRAAYETARPLPGSLDSKLDRLVLAADGPLTHGIAFAGALDADARLDADPVNAPAPTQELDPRRADPYHLAHNSGERLDAAGKLTVSLGKSSTLRLFGLRSIEQRLLYDPPYKYDQTFMPARRVGATLASVNLQHAAGSVVSEFRLGWFDRDFFQGALAQQPAYRVGAATLASFQFLGEDLARRQDTVAAHGPVPGFLPPDFSAATPWGVPAYFLGSGPRGDIDWNRFRELRGRFDLSLGAPAGEIGAGAEVIRQRVQTFQRALAYLPTVDSGVPRPAASDFSPTIASLYVEPQLHAPEFALTLGLRYDLFDPGGEGSRARPAHRSFSPRFAFSTVLNGATLVISYGRFSQAPDYQYLVDAAFDDTLRTGRFRRGNPDVGFERATQWEFSLRARPSRHTAIRLNTYFKKLDGLVASTPVGTNPDSAVFNTFDFGSAKGVELLVERELTEGWSVKVSYALAQAQATNSNAFELIRRVRGAPPPDSTLPSRLEVPLDYDRRHGLTAISELHVPHARWGVLVGLEGAAIARFFSGLPYSLTNATGDTLIGLPNSHRLPPQLTLDLLLRRPFALGGRRGSVYLDVRNVLNRRNVIAVRRDVGSPELTSGAIDSLAEAAYEAHPEPIPYESPRYRSYADLNGDGYIAGRAELFPLYQAAARDFTQPLFFYGAPRVMRIGVEYEF